LSKAIKGAPHNHGAKVSERRHSLEAGQCYQQLHQGDAGLEVWKLHAGLVSFRKAYRTRPQQ